MHFTINNKAKCAYGAVIPHTRITCVLIINCYRFTINGFTFTELNTRLATSCPLLSSVR